MPTKALVLLCFVLTTSECTNNNTIHGDFYEDYDYGGESDSEDADVGYVLGVGKAIDLFANFGDLVEESQVMSLDDNKPITPFSERNILVWENVVSLVENITMIMDERIKFVFCDNISDLLDRYYEDFEIEGTDQPYKAFMGHWLDEEIEKSFGLDELPISDPSNRCCYILVKLSKPMNNVSLGSMENVTLKDYFNSAVLGLNVSDVVDVQRFMRSFGTHYIHSYVTGNAVYQVFQYKNSTYLKLKNRFKRNSTLVKSNEIRYLFSSYFLKQIGKIQVASGNKTIEDWAQKNLRDGQYLYSKPSLVNVFFNSTLANHLSRILDDKALLSINLKMLKTLFVDADQRDKFEEIIDNEIKLWEVNM